VATDDWDAVRGQFALRPDVHHLAGFVLAPHPAVVRAAIARHRDALDADPVGYLHERQDELEGRVRAEAAGYLGGAPGEIALTDSTTMGLGLVYGGVRLPPGSEVLTSVHDFYATHEALRLRAARGGVRVRRIRLYSRPERASVDAIVSAVTRALTKRTRLVALTWVHSSTGVKLPVRELARALRGRALLSVDAVHALGVEPEGVRTTGADVVVAGTHKWLAGPRGTGIVWARAGLWPRLRATVPSFDDASSWAAWAGAGRPRATSALTMTPGGYHSFEHRWALAEAFALHRAIGKQRVADRVASLARRLKDGLSGAPGVRVVTPSGQRLSAGIVCCDVAGQAPRDVVQRLFDDHRVVATVTPYATPYVRFGAGLYANEDDVDAAVAALRAVAARRA
jgi:selenocysteine lyase/cysteine desulfurase